MPWDGLINDIFSVGLFGLVSIWDREVQTQLHAIIKLCECMLPDLPNKITPPPDKIKKWKFLTPQQRRFYILLSKCSLQLSYVVKKAKLAKYQNNISSPFLQLTMKPLYVIIMSRRLEWVCPIGGAHLTVPKDCKPFFLPHCNVAWRQAC